ncbi:uncharacterized protein LOC122669080 isoform X2 [Telopea speciosissima]|uniref:uncharacterized protein LOC122669080 isoform X2 n=1 Tax=Telopea speciosissima TaxID=54955 RepID=UPI001CC61C94|nr:uncharacterized protein LOC122669080 isoform X2 [Telopea speciosissima]
MDSPEGNRIVPTSSSSPPIQDSPFSNFLRTLSPIKSVKSIHVAQGFSELNFPPPPPVFTSPRINKQRRASFVKRPQFPHSSNAELSQADDSDKMVAGASDISSRSQKECDSKCSVQVQPCSPSGCVDEFLADPVDPEDSVNSIDSANLCLKQSNGAPKALENSSSLKESIEKVNDNIDNREGIDTEAVAASLTLLEKAEEEVPEKLLLPDNPVESEAEQQKDSGRLPGEYQCVISEKISAHGESDLSIQHDSVAQNDKNVVVQIAKDLSSIISMEEEHGDADFDKRQRSNRSRNPCQHRLEAVTLQNAEGGQQDEWDCTPQLLPESLHISQAYQDHDEKTGLILSVSLESRMQCDFEEASQHQRGTLRRCLQFETAEGRRNIVGSCCGQNPTNMTPGTPTDLGDMDLCNLGPSAGSSPKQPLDLSQPAPSKLSHSPVQNSETRVDKVDKSVRDCGNAAVTALVPTGIGLHLNSIVHASARVTGVSATMKLVEKSYVNVQEQKSFCVINHHFQDDSKSSPLPLRMIGEISSNIDDDRQESQATLLATSASSQLPDNMKAMKNSQQLKLTEHHSIPSHKRKSASESADMFEEFNQLSPKKGRKKASYNNQNEGCKRCNCKRSKCLKLYCECFAAGVYCADPCACQECFNKPEYEDTVLGTRQQIETRNPLAFAPKIVQRVSESSANSGEESNRMTPSSARHKRGCNCKRSLCLKKYCECFQSGVGCSEACRCEGCKNVYGVKEEMMYKRAVDERWEDLSNEKLDMVEARSDTSQWEHSHPQSLSPLTPSFDCSNHGKNVPKPRVPARRCLPSPESDSSALSSYGKSARSPNNNYETQQKTSKEVLDIVPYDQDLDFIKAGRVDQFLPRWDGHADICNLTPLPHPPSRAIASLASSNTSDHIKVSRAPSSRGSGHLSSVSSLRWHSSPITPMPHLGGSNFTSELDSDNGLYDILGDDTPEILKDTATPINVVKASSPNKKRVSPPHSRLHEVKSNSSLALRSGRKFILQAVPSFPPLSPDSDPKSSSGDK